MKSVFKRVENIPQDLVDAIIEETAVAREFLAIKNDEPTEIVTKIKAYVDTHFGSEILQEQAIQLGCLWAEAVIKKYGWSWKYLGEDDNMGVYIVSPNEYYSCPPLFFLTNIINGENIGLDGKNDNTILLLFNMFEGVERNIPSEKHTVLS